MYTDLRQTFSFDLKTADMAATPADDADLFQILITANREIEVQGFLASVRLPGAASSFLELVKDDNTVICKASTASAGFKSAVASDGTTATTFPQRVSPQSTSATSSLKIKVDGTLDATTDVTIQVTVSGLNHA